MDQLEIIRPDDWHVHLRDQALLHHTVKDISRYFGRAIVMPNLVPPVTNVEMAINYERRILGALADINADEPSDKKRGFKPLMTLYLTDNTTIEEIEKVQQNPNIAALKLYPAGATTNSDAGVTDVKKLYPIFEKMAELQVPLLVHGEVTHTEIDIFDREAVFIDQILSPLQTKIPQLKVVLEHITTKHATEYILSKEKNTAATITAHHLLYNRNHMLAGGIRPHYYCLPILKRSVHQQALVKAATSGDKRFFLGTDSAPHTQDKKEQACGCAGCYTAAYALELYAEVFEQENALDQLEKFASLNGANFYNLALNEETITLVKKPQQVPSYLPMGDSRVIPIRAGETLSWRVLA